jgi:hypothetical protein
VPPDARPVGPGAVEARPVGAGVVVDAEGVDALAGADDSAAGSGSPSSEPISSENGRRGRGGSVR